MVAHLCPFPPVHGNRTRFAGFLEWLRQKQFDVTFILQPLDVEDIRGLDQLRQLVARLEIVQRQTWTGARRLQRAASSAARAFLPARLAAWLRPVARTLTPAPPPVREVWGTGTMGGDCHIDGWCWPTTRAAVRRAVARDRPVAVLAEYALLSKCLDDVPPGVLKIIDTVEVFFRNEDRFRIDGLEAPVVCSPSSEKTALDRADLLIAIQKNDAKALQELFPGKTVITVSHSYRQISRRPDDPAVGTILYVGSSNPFNIHGLRQFVEHAWPKIASRVPHATLRIVGSMPSIDGVDGPRILHMGRVTDEQLAREYQTANVVINPQVAGTGLKIKCVEALSAACPLVVNAAGADGLEDGAGLAYLLAKNWATFAEHVVTLLTDDEARRALEVQARVFADRMFAPGATFLELDAVLRQCVFEADPGDV